MRRPSTVTGVAAVTLLLLAELAVRQASGYLPDWRSWPTPETSLKYTQMADLGDTAVVFVGSSSTEAGIDPAIVSKQIGTSVYNAALPFGTPIGDSIWLSDYVVPLTAPDLVVVGIPTWLIQTTESDDPLVAGLRIVDRETDAEYFGLELLRRRRQFRYWQVVQSQLSLERSDLWTSAGHQTGYYDGRIHSADGSDTVHVVDGSLLSVAQAEALEANATNLLAEGIEVIFLFEPPGCPTRRTECVVSDKSISQHPARSIASRLGIRIIDVVGLEWPSTMYADSVHLNRQGTLRLSSIVGSELNEVLDR